MPHFSLVFKFSNNIYATYIQIKNKEKTLISKIEIKILFSFPLVILIIPLLFFYPTSTASFLIA